MRYCVLILLFFMPLSASAQNAAAPQTSIAPQSTLIKNIEIEGFVLGDKAQFVKLFKPYHNKHLTAMDMDAILQQIKDIYEREGYLELVSITYQVNKHRLIFTVLMTS
jgi:hemolysin activation/secretion protein